MPLCGTAASQPSRTKIVLTGLWRVAWVRPPVTCPNTSAGKGLFKPHSVFVPWSPCLSRVYSDTVLDFHYKVFCFCQLFCKRLAVLSWHVPGQNPPPETRNPKPKTSPAGINHRLYLIDRKPGEAADASGCPSEQFVVLGATGNVYTVEIGRTPSCTCPDAAKGNICKHRFFVMLRVLKAGEGNPAVWQHALLDSEVRPACFSKWPVCETWFRSLASQGGCG